MENTSRERFLAQLDRCVRYQNENITLPDPPRSPEAINESYEFIPLDAMGNGQPEAHVDTASVWGLRPPGDATPVTGDGGWA